MERPRGYTRREAFRLFGLAAVGTAFAACATAETQPFSESPQKTKTIPEQRAENQAAIELIKENPLMAPEAFDRMSRAMENSSSSLLRLLSRGIKLFWSAEENPPGTPSWLDKNLTPFVITVDESETSYVQDQISPQNRFMVYTCPDFPEGIVYQMVGSVDIGIHLGIPQYVQDVGPLAMSLCLAKESLNFLGQVPIAQRLVDYYRSCCAADFLDQETRQPIIDQREREIAGFSFFAHQVLCKKEGQDDSEMRRLFDGFPVLLVGTQLFNLASRKEILKVSEAMVPFFIAANLVEDPQRTDLKKRLLGFIKRWSTSRSVFPPDDFFDLMMDPEVRSTLDVWQNKIQAYSASE